MHASILVGMMIVGGYMYPETEITTVPLKDDLSSVSSIQDLEWKEQTRARTLPRVPTIADRQEVSDNSRGTGNSGNRFNPINPYSQPRSEAMPQMPTSPTGDLQGQSNQRMPSQPGSGGYGGQAGGYGHPGYQPTASGNNLYPNSPVSNRVTGYPGSAGIGVQGTPQVPTVNSYTAGNPNSVAAYENRYGLAGQSQYGAASPYSGDASKPFSGYTPPSGYSAWNNLQLPTNNGTVSPYTNYVRPAFDQQNFNSHVSEQINGVRTQMPYGAGTPGVESPVSSGAGLNNPNAQINYGTY